MTAYGLLDTPVDSGANSKCVNTNEADFVVSATRGNIMTITIPPIT